MANDSRFISCVLLLSALLMGSAARAGDTDSDGFPDSIEALLGTDPNSAASTPTGSSITPTPFLQNTGGAIGLDFVDPMMDTLSVSGYISLPAGIDFTGKQVAVDIGGYTELFTLDASGGSSFSNPSVVFFTPNSNATSPGTHFFEVSVSNVPLATFFSDEGLLNQTFTNQAISIDVTIFFNDTLNQSTFAGVYNATAGSSGIASFITGSFFEPVDIVIHDFAAQPNPANVGDLITFTASVHAESKDASISATVDFGDGTAPLNLSGLELEAAEKDGVTHAYAAQGIYFAELTIFSGSSSVSSELFVVIGTGSVVNSLNGLASTANLGTDGTLSLQINVSKVPGATTATTEFSDSLSREVIDGLVPSRAVSVPGITVATTTAKDDGGQPKGKVRKMVPIGGRNVGDSGALPPPPSSEVVLSKVSGKFVFTESKPDQVSFSGSVTLPQGFSPTKEGGNTLVFGMGNIVDKIMVDAKGKAINKSTGDSGRIKKLSIKYPKLTGGVAAGGEVAKISITFVMTGMSNAGFDTEGIVPTLRADEAGRKAVQRFIQISLLLAEVPYEAYIPVSFKVSKKADAGQISGRAAK